MEPERLEYFRNLLQERLEEILGEADKTRIDMTGVTAPFPDPTDRATLETDRNFTLQDPRPGTEIDQQDQGSPGPDRCRHLRLLRPLRRRDHRKAPQSPPGDHHVHRLQIQGGSPGTVPGPVSVCLAPILRGHQPTGWGALPSTGTRDSIIYPRRHSFHDSPP